MFDSELDEFKRHIDLRAYAAAHGYRLDRKESSRGSSVMRHPASNDKIIVKRDGRAYLWFSVRTDTGGTIIDFVMHLRKRNLGEVRKELRPWLGKASSLLPRFTPLDITRVDSAKVAARYAAMADVSSGHPYLERERALPVAVLGLRRFAGRIKIDGEHGNAVFPHFDGDGLCGYELKNLGFTGFSAGGTKGLWLSHEFVDDERLVVCESAIDALSFAALFGANRTRFASIGGNPNPGQPALLEAAIARLPACAEVVSAMDADDDGRKLGAMLRQAFDAAGRTDLSFRVQEPVGFKDFNDQLRGSRSLAALPGSPAPGPA